LAPPFFFFFFFFFLSLFISRPPTRDPALTAALWRDFLLAIGAEPSFCSADPLVRLASEGLSTPVTVAYLAGRGALGPALAHSLAADIGSGSGSSSGAAPHPRLTIGVVSDLPGDTRAWEVLLHLAPRVAALDLVLYGAASDAPWTHTALCEACTGAGRSLRVRRFAQRISKAAALGGRRTADATTGADRSSSSESRHSGSSSTAPDGTDINNNSTTALDKSPEPHALDLAVLIGADLSTPAGAADWARVTAAARHVAVLAHFRSAAVRAAAVLARGLGTPLQLNPVVNPFHGAVPHSVPGGAYGWKNLFAGVWCGQPENHQ
jgi:hypothetical protein